MIDGLDEHIHAAMSNFPVSDQKMEYIRNETKNDENMQLLIKIGGWGRLSKTIIVVPNKVNIKTEMTHAKQRSTFRFDNRANTLKPLSIGEGIRVRLCKFWKPAIV